MMLSPDGKRLIYSFEGLHKKRGDGTYEAYLCPAGVPTIYCGLTEGVSLGMIVTEAEGEALFDVEIEKFERGVTRLTTVELTQNQFDALVSFSYNVGLGALEGSTLLKAVNRGDFDAAARAFHAWNKGGGKILPGLVQRRIREAALFMKPAHAPDEPAMPQAVTKSVEAPSKGTIAAGTATATGAATQIPVPPDLSPALSWQSFGETIGTLGTWALNRPLLTIGLGLYIAALMFAPSIVSRLPSFARQP